jgi:uncharacterized membrane protein
MSLLSLRVLFHFIHNVSESIQAQNIIAKVRRDLDKAVYRIFPEKVGQEERLSSGPLKRNDDIPRICDRKDLEKRYEAALDRLPSFHQLMKTILSKF